MIPKELKKGGVKKASAISLVLAGVSILLMFFLFLIIIPYVGAAYPSEDIGPAMLLLSILLIIFVLLVLGLVFGVVGLFKNKKKTLAGWGTFLNGFFFFIYIVGVQYFL